MAVSPREISPPRDPAVLFVGSAHPPNIDGVTWFLAQVWPTIKSEFPAATFLIAGSVCSAFPNPLPEGVRLLGRLPDLAVAYAQAGIVIAPIFQGSGIKIKLLEAIGYGRACVTTSVGLEGLEALREELCIADSAEAFTRVTRELLADPARAAHLGSGLQSKARKYLSPEACYGPTADLLRTLSSRPN
jgi:succinoglycan biosynthesis protein ExoO